MELRLKPRVISLLKISLIHLVVSIEHRLLRDEQSQDDSV